MSKKWDLWAYWALVIALGLYALYLKGTCQELGCLAIIIPIIGIMILSLLEFITGMIIRMKGIDSGMFRTTTLIISGIITVFSLGAIILSL
jgi:hypothetical protein